MYRVAIQREFIARHCLTVPGCGPEHGPHSHHYRCEMCLEGEELDAHGYLADIDAMKEALDAALEPYRDRLLNETPAFAGLNPSLEHFCRILWQALAERLPPTGHSLTLRLWESATDWAAYEDRL